MSTPDLSAFNFSFDPTLDTWAVSDKPAELDSSEIFLPNVEGRTEFLAPDPDRVPVIENSVRTDDPTYAARPAEERTRELLSQMRPHRATLLGILAACETPMATSAMKEAVERISGRKFSVYTPSNFCTMLEVAGGLARVTDAGEPYTDEVRAPEMVEVDGRAFWRPTTPPPVYWQTTEAGATVLAEDAPMELIGTFGFHTSADTDKFAACASAVDGAEVPYVTEYGLARFSVSVTETIDVGSHYLFVGVVEEAEVLASGDPLTYAYYHAVKGGKTPPKAATYNGGGPCAR